MTESDQPQNQPIVDWEKEINSIPDRRARYPSWLRLQNLKPVFQRVRDIRSESEIASAIYKPSGFHHPNNDDFGSEEEAQWTPTRRQILGSAVGGGLIALGAGSLFLSRERIIEDGEKEKVEIPFAILRDSVVVDLMDYNLIVEPADTDNYRYINSTTQINSQPINVNEPFVLQNPDLVEREIDGQESVWIRVSATVEEVDLRHFLYIDLNSAIEVNGIEYPNGEPPLAPLYGEGSIGVFERGRVLQR